MKNKASDKVKNRSAAPKKAAINIGKSGIAGQITRNKYAFLIIALITIVAYSGIFYSNIVFFDDNTMMQNVAKLKTGDVHILKDSFRLDAMAGQSGMFYRPFQTFVLIVVSYLGGTKIYLAFLLIFHLINAFLLFYILTLLKADRIKALLLTLVFAVHPLFVPVLNWIPSIGDVSVTLFVFIAFISFIRFVNNANPMYVVIHIFGFGLAMFSKEIAIVAPLIFAAYFFLFCERALNRKRLTGIIIIVAFWIIIPLVFIYIRNLHVDPSDTERAKISIAAFLSNIPILFDYIAKFVFPVKLALIASQSWIRFFAGVVVISAVAYFTVKQGKTKMAVFSVLWLVFFLSPTLIFDHPHYDYLEHRGYLPLVAIIMLLSVIKLQKYELTAYVIIIPLFCILAFNRTQSFNNPVRFYESIIKNEKIALAFNNLAIEKDNLQDYQSALKFFTEAIAINPSYTDAYFNRGNLKSQRMNNFGGAIEDYRQAIRLIESGKTQAGDAEAYADVYNNMGTSKYRLNDIDGALNDYSKAVEILPNFARVYYNRGILKAEGLKDYEGALSDLSKAIDCDPRYYEAYNNRGVIKETRLNDYVGALADYNAAITLKPDFALAYFNRGMNHYSLHDLKGACSDWQTATRLGHAGARQMLDQYCK